MQDLTLVMAQLDPLVGDIPGNTDLAIETVREACIEHGADIVVLPELFLTGYPPEDLLFRPSMEKRLREARVRMAEKIARDVLVIVGYPGRREGKLYNLAGLLYNGEWQEEYAKQALPNYQVFDEQRYFSPGQETLVFKHKGVRLGILICEDIWEDAPVAQARKAGADILITLNASPYHQDKPAERLRLLAGRAEQVKCPLVYVNQIGGQDDLVFDGGSAVVDAKGQLKVQAPYWQVGLMPAQFIKTKKGWEPRAGEVEPEVDPEESLYCALVTGLRDYVNKSGFKGVVLGLSGGIDSALSLAIAVDALGPQRVQAVMMPYHYTSEISKEDAAKQAKMLGVHYEVLPIAPIVEAFDDTLAESFAGTPRDTTEENLQSRVRGTLLMAISNKKGVMVLTTGNKSEMAVGYATLYGDMVGGYNALKDVYKTWVYRLAKWRNTQEPAIPERVIERPPSAELAAGQQDSDSLPPYDTLDAILSRYIEGDMSAEAIIDAGFDRDDVYQVVKLVDRSEYKRRQAPIGVRVTPRGFGRDRRYPIVNGWQPGE
ncbi:NAD synthetase [Litchfieldella anticariensis FP35 = DSM 16096]|uniref:Glutamine-dependent NAD(+) synthetase n=1 Tax=Litchfieldella anticariensis (strain DSM 16096 / CECT 5854 / CIP 108499 / LMG 22089 / FP35) TaxID=1121939 RepID=S2L5E1_LITA3|nr:NAD+ synthase [Halomonas anticariensis]EPC00006.1 NAD synthetase [Halomonas anticariensis FP35 = DSM 16096]